MLVEQAPPPAGPKEFGDFTTFNDQGKRTLTQKLAQKAYEPGAAKRVDFSTPNIGNHCFLALSLMTFTIVILLFAGVLTSKRSNSYPECPVKADTRCDERYKTRVYFRKYEYTRGLVPEDCIPLCGRLPKAKAIEVHRRANDLECHCIDFCRPVSGPKSLWVISLQNECDFQK